MVIQNGKVYISPCKRPKKITGTKFAAIMGLNKWNTPFKTWCDICRVYHDPFIESKETIAGKIIENKVVRFLQTTYGMAIKPPEDVYGDNFFNVMHGDFYHEEPILGGMWDVIGNDTIVEIKTTKRVEDWQDEQGNPRAPLYYELQACLYAYLSNKPNVVITATFLKPEDYPVKTDDGWTTTPTDNFEPTLDNTIVISFVLAEKYPNFEEDYVNKALDWWGNHIIAGVSPEFDEVRDKEVLKVITNKAISSDNVEDMLDEAIQLQYQIKEKEDEYKDLVTRLDEIKKSLKDYMKPEIKDGYRAVTYTRDGTNIQCSKRERKVIDFDRLKEEHPEIYDEYVSNNEYYVINFKEEK